MQYPVIDLITDAYLNNGWTGLDIPETITYEPIQLGSGEPSPDNIRPILPATILNIGGNDVPVYGGTLDVATGVLTVDRDEVDLGTLTWSYRTGSGLGDYFYASFYGIKYAGDFSYTAYPLLLSTGYTPSARSSASFVDKCICVDGITSEQRPTQLQIKDSEYTNATTFNTAIDGVQLVYELATPTTYQLNPTELATAIGIDNYIAHRLKLPLPHYFPHPVIDALQRAAAGTQTADDTEILRHYLTPLGIGGI